VVRDGRRREEAGELKPTVAVRRAHHCNLYALIAQSSDTSGPFSFNRGPTFEFEAELAKEINRLSEVIDDDSYVVHPFECHVPNLLITAPLCKRTPGYAGSMRTRKCTSRTLTKARPNSPGPLPYLIHPPSRMSSSAAWVRFRDETLRPLIAARPDDVDLPRFLA
jgi:hypothetical protein